MQDLGALCVRLPVSNVDNVLASNINVNFLKLGSKMTDKHTVTHSLFGLMTGVALLAAPALQASPYVGVANPIPPAAGDVVPSPTVVPGKEFSEEMDRNTVPVADPLQTILWDGSGGTMDGTDFGDVGQIDAMANKLDALFDPVIENKTTLLFSTRELNGGLSEPSSSAMPRTPVAPGVDAGLRPLGCAPGDPICYERISGPVGTWATDPMVDGMNPLDNLDALEVWGLDGITDTTHYSLTGDAALGVSIFNDTGISYMDHATLLNGIMASSLFDEITTDGIKRYGVDLDALMVRDAGVNGRWDEGDAIMFSLWEDPFAGIIGDGVYTWEFGEVIEVLDHGQHLWFDGWTAELDYAVNVDGLEAVSEPSMFALLGISTLGFVVMRRRRVLS